MQSVQRVDQSPVMAQPARPQNEGLRERKRREARTATQRHAIELCLEHGYDAVTVDMICDTAGISARTFYNYFGSREGAVIGDSKPQPQAHHIAEFIAARDCSHVEAFAVMMARVWTESELDREVFVMRRRLLDATPELMALNMARVTEARGQYAAVARQRLEAHQPGLTDQDYDTDAALVVSLGLGMLQVVARPWLSGDDATPLDTLVHDYFPRMRRLTQAPGASHHCPPGG